MLELIVEFKNAHRDADRSDFKTFTELVKTSTNANVKNSYDFLYRVVQPLFIFRVGLRKNNAHLINAGLKLMLQLFWGTHKNKSVSTHYRTIVLHHLIMRSRLPPKLVEFFEQT